MKHDLEKQRLAYVLCGRCVRCGQKDVSSFTDDCPSTLRWEDIFNRDGSRKVKLTPEQVVEDRKRGIAFQQLPEDVIFTCDTCEVRNNCAYAFDGYNTNGDCLAEK